MRKINGYLYGIGRLVLADVIRGRISEVVNGLFNTQKRMTSMQMAEITIPLIGNYNNLKSSLDNLLNSLPINSMSFIANQNHSKIYSFLCNSFLESEWCFLIT